MHEQEKRIKEQRTIEANRKKLMGLDGKLGCILKYLGEPLIRQDEGDWFHSSRYLDEEDSRRETTWGGTPEEIIEQIPTDDWGDLLPDECYRSQPVKYDTEEIGMVFDGLSSGMNLEIRYLKQDNLLTVKHEGRLVYREVAGELEAYVPAPQWEDMVNRLFPLAKKREVTAIGEAVQQRREKNRKDKLGFLEKLRTKWGI